jgi:RNA polymerase sigma-70 factor (ECF subfamily)
MAPRIDAALVERLYGRAGAARWQVSTSWFVKALEASAAKGLAAHHSRAELERYLTALRLEDLALACACASGSEPAWEHFILTYRPILYRAADALDPGGGGRELADSLYADLFGLQDRGGERQSLFRYFHGRSSLATWLRSVLAQRLVDRARAGRRLAPLPEEEPPGGEEPPDLERSRYLTLVLDAFGKAVAQLDPRDRLRLRYYYAQGLTLAETGRLLREHEASVSRHLAAARKAIRRDVERQLREQGLTPGEVSRGFECVTQDPGTLDLDGMLERSQGPTGARSGGLIVHSKEG